MTKYQLVYIKLETLITNLIQIKKKSSQRQIKYCFDKLRLNSKSNLVELKSNFILIKIKAAIGSLISLKRNKLRIILFSKFKKWNNQTHLASFIQKLKEQNEKKLLNAKSELETSKKKVKDLEGLTAEQDKKIVELQLYEKDQNEKIQEKEENERNLKDKIEKLEKKGN